MDGVWHFLHVNIRDNIKRILLFRHGSFILAYWPKLTIIPQCVLLCLGSAGGIGSAGVSPALGSAGVFACIMGRRRLACKSKIRQWLIFYSPSSRTWSGWVRFSISSGSSNSEINWRRHSHRLLFWSTLQFFLFFRFSIPFSHGVLFACEWILMSTGPFMCWHQAWHSGLCRLRGDHSVRSFIKM